LIAASAMTVPGGKIAEAAIKLIADLNAKLGYGPAKAAE